MAFQVGVFQTNFQQSGAPPIPVSESRSGAVGGGKKQRRKRFVLPNGDVVFATKDEIERSIALWHELNPEAYVEEPLKPAPVQRKIVVKGEAPTVEYVEFKEPEKPVRMMRLKEGRIFGPGHPLYENVLRELQRRKEEDEFLMMIIEHV